MMGIDSTRAGLDAREGLGGDFVRQPVTSPWRDLDRPPLRPAALRGALVTSEGVWTELRVVAETGSTNADVAAAARAGAAEGLVVVAELQTAGRGRADRTWQAPLR